MSTEKTISAAIQAGYLTHGLITARTNAPDESGEIESVESIMDFVPLVEAVVAQAVASKYQFSGVFEYEVTEKIGAWLHGQMPVTKRAFVVKLLALSRSFFGNECEELHSALSGFVQEEPMVPFKQVFGSKVFSLHNANDSSEDKAQLGIVHDDFVITDASMSTCGRFFVDSMAEYQITHEQRDLLVTINSLLDSMVKNRVSVLADPAIKDVFGLQQKVLAHPDLQAHLSNVIGALMLDIIESEKA